MSEQEEIGTPFGSLWVKFQETGELRIWWPYLSRVGELVMFL